MKRSLKIAAKIFEVDIIFFLLLTVVTLATYWQLISIDTILNYDDKVLLDSISQITSFKHYWISIKNGFILDIQPIRDLSYILDIKLKTLFPFYSFHLTNIIIWLLICQTVRKIFILHSPKSYIIISLLVLIYALSPVSSSSVAWIAARKHLLSTLFISYATLIFLKNKNSLTCSYVLLIFFSYLLSCFSQPINSLWVFWLIFNTPRTSYKSRWNIILTTLSLIIFSISIGFNFYYYRFIYSKNVSSISKFSNFQTLDLGDPLLAIGRYFYQCFFPFAALPSSHYQGSWENLFGLFALVLFFSFIFKKIKNNRFTLLSATSYFFLPLVIVTLNMTNVFCSDTYLLNSSIGFYWVLLILFEQINYKKIIIKFLSGYLLVVMIYNYQYVKIFINEDKLWLYSYEKEATSQTSIIASSIYVKQKNFQKSFEIISEIQSRWPNQPYLPQAIAENIFFNFNIPNALKITALKNITPQTPSTFLYLTITYGLENNPEELKKVINLIFDQPVKFNMEFHGNEDKLASIYLYTCDYFKLKKCEDNLHNFKEKVLNHKWNDEIIQEYLNQLKSQPNYNINL